MSQNLKNFCNLVPAFYKIESNKRSFFCFRLDLNGSYRVCDATVQVITRNFPNLKHLTLIGCAFCGDAACSAISNGLDKLESLQIEEWTYVTQTGIELLIAKNLKFLSVQCRQINGGQLFIQGSQTLL